MDCKDTIDNIDTTDNSEEYIRSPDKVIKERLIWKEEEFEEFEEDILQNMVDYEKEIQKYFVEEKMRRKDTFNELLFKMKKISNYDKEVEEIENHKKVLNEI